MFWLEYLRTIVLLFSILRENASLIHKKCSRRPNLSTFYLIFANALVLVWKCRRDAANLDCKMK
jgi:hypothetical protein